jgi:hypothetical protein
MDVRNGHIFNKGYIEPYQGILANSILIDPSELACLNNCTSNIQTQITNNVNSITSLNTRITTDETNTTTSVNSLNTRITTDETNITTLNSKLTGITTTPCNIIGLSSDAFTYDSTTINNNIYQQYGKYNNILDSFVFMKNTPTYTNKNYYLDAIGSVNEVLIAQIYLLKNQYIGDIDINLSLSFNKIFSQYSSLSSVGNSINADMTLNSITLNFYLDNVIISTKTISVNINKSFLVPYYKNFYTGYTYQESSQFIVMLSHINIFSNMFMDTDKLLQIKGTMNVTVNSSFSSNVDISAINSSYFSFNSSDANNLKSTFNFFVGDYRTNQLTAGAFYLNQLNSNRVYTENIEVDNVIVSNSLSFNSATTCFYNKQTTFFNCNLTSGAGGSVTTISLSSYSSGFYKFSVVIDGAINDINTNVFWDCIYDGNNCKIFNISNTDFGWSITNNLNSKSFNISAYYPTGYQTFYFYKWKLF